MGKKKVIKYKDAPVSHSMVREALAEYNRPNDKISELIKSGNLIPLRRGLYIQPSESEFSIPDLFLIANHLRGPSYVSLEAALSYWDFIPERVYEITSATIKSTKTYKTPLGRFSYHHLSFPYFSFGIKNIKITAKQTALMASPEKAICDKIILTSGVNLRSMKQTEAFLIEDLRIDSANLESLDVQTITSWIPDAPKKSSLKMLVKTIENL